MELDEIENAHLERLKPNFWLEEIKNELLAVSKQKIFLEKKIEILEVLIKKLES